MIITDEFIGDIENIAYNFKKLSEEKDVSLTIYNDNSLKSSIEKLLKLARILRSNKAVIYLKEE